MKKDAEPNHSFIEEKELLLSLASMFEGEFSLDWLVELTGMKASIILAILEEATKDGLFTRNRPGIIMQHTRIAAAMIR